jgi:hypothetical protein
MGLGNPLQVGKQHVAARQPGSCLPAFLIFSVVLLLVCCAVALKHGAGLLHSAMLYAEWAFTHRA